MNHKTKKISIVGMLCAMAYMAAAVGRIPIVLFLKYDPKDVVIAISGLIYGPFTSFLIAFIVSLIEMFSISENGILGFIMNVISSCSFACTAAFIYKRKHKLSGAITGLFLWMGLHGLRNAALELYDWSDLYGLSEGSCCKATTSCIFSFQFNQRRAECGCYNDSL